MLSVIGTFVGMILVLVVMEGLLSADNALVLAKMVGTLKDKTSEKKALIYGVWGAIAFRVLIIAGWGLLARVGWLIWAIQLLVAVYLAKMTWEYFSGKDSEDEDNDGIADKYQRTWIHKGLSKIGIKLSTFWSVVISVEIMDVAFSTDSISAAFAISTNFWILALGGALGIIMMRKVADIFLVLIDKVPEFNGTAFILIGIIALRMFGANFYHILNLAGFKNAQPVTISDIYFFIILIVTFLGTFLVHKLKQNKPVEAK